MKRKRIASGFTPSKGRRPDTWFSFLVFLFSIAAPSLPDKYSDQECLTCHGKPEISQVTKEGEVRSLFVDPEKWSADVHQKGRILCVDCHLNANPYVHFREGFIKVDCARCHPEEAEEYQKNIHLTFAAPTAGKEFPLCYHCHTRHHVLLHDDPASSVNEQNVSATCGSCHPEVMVRSIVRGTSLGKISGHRKGDLSERFDMQVCLNCHYEDSGHGAKRVYRDFCSRCHNPRSKSGMAIGSIHLDSQRMSGINRMSNGLVGLFLFGLLVLAGYKSRKGIVHRVRTWQSRLRTAAEAPEKEETGGKTERAEKKEQESAEAAGEKEPNPDGNDRDLNL